MGGEHHTSNSWTKHNYETLSSISFDHVQPQFEGRSVYETPWDPLSLPSSSQEKNKRLNGSKSENSKKILDASNKKAHKKGRPTYGYTSVWFCHNCGHGGMSTYITHCPDCGHGRCGSCQWEQWEVLVED